ncbi:MAG TPA: hypothetical protein VNU44_13800 [Bryobacteraceae bacterium]|nr:hypothetical protein [Bryobacteraceae bacterium]
MTITPTPEQERILAEALEAGLIERAEDALNVGLETLRSRLPARPAEETAEEWIAKFNAWADSHADQTVVLSDEAMEPGVDLR